jgi:peptide/nickel transport system permease protein
MLRLVLRRLLQSIPIALAVLAVTFLLIRLGGGDPSGAILGVSGTVEQRAQLREELGLNRPIINQFGTYLNQLAHGHLGNSLINQEPVGTTIQQSLPVTLSTTLGALLVSLVIGVPLGMLIAIRAGRFDRVVQVITVLFSALPGFWLALILIVFFSVRLGWLPTSGYSTLAEYGFTAWLKSIVLPIAALACVSTAAITLQTRARVIDVLEQDFIRNLRASGVSSRRIIGKHVLKNIGGTIATVAGLQFIGLLGAVVLIEQVFALPGIGRLAVNAALQYDYTTLQAIVVVVTLLVVATNLIIELLRAWLTPRARLS